MYLLGCGLEFCYSIEVLLEFEEYFIALFYFIYWDPGVERVPNMPTSIVIGCFVEFLRGSSYLVLACGGAILYSV